MPDIDDLDLDPSPEGEPGEPFSEPPEPEGSGWGVRAGLAAGLLLLVAGVAAIFMLVFRPPAPPRPTPPTTTAAASPLPSPTAPPPPRLPALGASDAFVRDAAHALSTHPQLAVWLGATDLVRRLVAVVDNVAAGQGPSPHLPFLAPKAPFAVIEKRGRTVIDLKSYARWDLFAEAVASIDAAEAARLFVLLEPLFEAAWRELGHPEPFRRGVARASEALLAVPVVPGEVAVVSVVRAVRVYEYADPRLEALTPAQKQLLRMGPDNVRRIQAKLRDVLAALGPPGPSGGPGPASPPAAP